MHSHASSVFESADAAWLLFFRFSRGLHRRGDGHEHRYLAVLLFSISTAAGNFLLGASWGTCLDIGGRHVGVIGACMNTSGQIGGMLSPVILGYAVQHFASWSAPLYLTGGLHMIGALCWLVIDPAKKLD